MRRSNTFHPAHEPFRSNDSLSLLASHTTGPIPFLNPTRAHFHLCASESQNSQIPNSRSRAPTSISSREKETVRFQPPIPAKAQNVSNVQYEWSSRNNRKGRHTLLADPSPCSTDISHIFLGPTSTVGATARGIARMFTYYPFWDISYLVAIIFTLGSVIWVINAFFVWLPLQDPSTEFTNEISIGGGWTAFVGATIFEIGSVLLMFEAVNENRAGCFGWALERVFDEKVGHWMIKAAQDRDACKHHHANKKNFVGEGTKTVQDGVKAWRWFPTWYELSTHYLHELGFLAVLSQFFGATIFWISGFTALPVIYDVLAANQKALDGGFWTPQIIGGVGFIVSGILFMLETQKKWYQPALGVLGWHIGLWNLVGAFGFTLCGALGPAYGNQGAQYAASLATFWGSWAFLIGSVIQWYESLDTYPVEKIKGKDMGQKRVPMKDKQEEPPSTKLVEVG